LRLVVVVVNWNGLNDTIVCVDSVLAADGRPSVIVVDNGSVGSDAEVLATRFGEDIQLIRSPTNLGFAGGANLGIREALGQGAEYVYTLNNDTRVEADAFREAIRIAEGPGRPTMVASKLYLMEPAGRLNSTGFNILPDGAAIDRGRFEPDEGQFDRHTQIFGPCAGAALYRASLFVDVGLFDEDFFAYAEDVDLAWRARRRGHTAAFAPTSHVHHKYSASSGAFSPFKVYQGERNRHWVLWKNYPAARVAVAPFVNAVKLARMAMAPAAGHGRGRKYAEAVGPAKIASTLAKARWDAYARLPLMVKKRRQILRTTLVDEGEIARWFRELAVPMKEAHRR
jgi:GT2 family glycosyltransferase